MQIKTHCVFSLIMAMMLVMLTYNVSFAQSMGKIIGHIKSTDTARTQLTIFVNSQMKTVVDNKGYFEVADIPYGKISLEVYSDGLRKYMKMVHVSKPLVEVNLVITEASIIELDDVVVQDQLRVNGLGRMSDVRGTAIFAAKKNDVLIMQNLSANLAINNARQVFSKTAGTNVWENDGSGIQLNVSSRGLSPNRSWEYNMRQNEYDIAADILGYPDMYYSPPMEAISHIEVVRGSASLQYGTQLGGLLNFVLKKGSETKPVEVESKQSVGAYGLFNSFNSIGGTKNKWRYYGYFHHRSANGWRDNSDYKWNTGFIALSYKATDKFTISAEYTRMKFLLHLSAGLTDSMFRVNPRGSVRERNWFKVDWNIPSVKLEYKFSENSQLSIITYMLLSSRKSVENTKPVNITADTGNRDIRNDYYHNFGTEIRYINRYRISPKVSGTLASGVRYYKGRTKRGQGLGNASSEPDFSFLHPFALEYSDYTFRTSNVAFFAENIFKVGKLSIVPGVRYEYIRFLADGYYNASGTLIMENGLLSKRQFPLFGIGLEYQLRPSVSLYGNATQGYRAANFNDIRITSPNIEIDPNLKDSRGYNIDLGIRGKLKNILSFDLSGFYLGYNDRIGTVTRTRPDNSTYLLSTNVASSGNMGLESFLEADLMKLVKETSKTKLTLYTSYSYINARYLKSDKDFLKNKKVEFAPQHILRSGLTLKTGSITSTFNFSHVSKQFSDANNTVFVATGSNGVIPSYSVMDWTSEYVLGNYKFGFSVNNIANAKYFTRRATSYPGPGIIPADPTTVLVSFGIKI